MLRLHVETFDLIDEELKSIPEKYQKPFNSTHEGLAVLMEEFEELKEQVFFGHKLAIDVYDFINPHTDENQKAISDLHKRRIREEAIQVAAMAVRIIQELT